MKYVFILYLIENYDCILYKLLFNMSHFSLEMLAWNFVFSLLLQVTCEPWLSLLPFSGLFGTDFQ